MFMVTLYIFRYLKMFPGTFFGALRIVLAEDMGPMFPNTILKLLEQLGFFSESPFQNIYGLDSLNFKS